MIPRMPNRDTNGGLRRRYLVFDTANPPYHSNRIFDPQMACQYPGGLALCRLYELATSAGYIVLTSDLMRVEKIDPQNAILLTEQWSPDTERLITEGALPGIVFSLESLWPAWSFYRRLRKISSVYQHVFLFPGVRRRVDETKTCFHPIFFPQSQREVTDKSNTPWSNKRFLALINSNLPPGSLRRWTACLIDSELRSELYTERLRAIRYFSGNPSFDLYGRGWETRYRRMPMDFHLAAVRSYKGSCKNKVSTLAEYQFSICFENAHFPGYITEKVFDCFFAGCIPIYYGAPDIEKYVPKETFIDFRNFNGYGDLDKYLQEVSSSTACSYLEAAKAFLASKAFEPFYQDYFASSVLSALNDCNNGTTVE